MKVYKVRDISKETSKPWRIYAGYNEQEVIEEARFNDDNLGGKYEAEHYELYSRTKKVKPKFKEHFEAVEAEDV